MIEKPDWLPHWPGKDAIQVARRLLFHRALKYMETSPVEANALQAAVLRCKDFRKQIRCFCGEIATLDDLPAVFIAIIATARDRAHRAIPCVVYVPPPESHSIINSLDQEDRRIIATILVHDFFGEGAGDVRSLTEELCGSAELEGEIDEAPDPTDLDDVARELQALHLRIIEGTLSRD